MIVLDEQLMGRDIDTAIARWYAGNVCFITDLRPETVIKDDSIPVLLKAASLPTFVTINVTDFWGMAKPSKEFCIVCVSMNDRHVVDIPDTVRRLFRLKPFATKQSRMGYVVLLTTDLARYYRFDNPAVIYSLSLNPAR